MAKGTVDAAIWTLDRMREAHTVGSELIGRATGAAGELAAQAAAVGAALLDGKDPVTFIREQAATLAGDIRARLAAGQTQEEILDAYVARYGKRILAVPPASGFDLTLYVAPVIALLVSVALVVVVVRRFTARPPAPEPVAAGAAPTAGTALESRLDDELRDLD